MRSAVVVLLLSAVPVAACSVCGPALLAKNTLREELSQSKAAVVGTLKNPKANTSGPGGTTEFHFAKPLKTAAIVEKKAGVTVPQYFPVIGDTPPDYLFFFDEVNGQPTITGGVPSTAAVVDYLTAAAKLDATDGTTRLAFYFKHLDAADPTVAADAFLEFAKAPDGDILKAKAAFDADRLVKLLANPKTPDERLGVFAALLGLCGEAKHVATFAELLKEPLTDRVRSSLGGVLAGLVLLEPKAGWKAVRAVLGDDKRPFEQRLAALGTVRFLQATRPEAKADVLAACGGMLGSADFADLVIEDLRRWGWWDLTAEVFAAWGQPAGEVREVKKAIVRYALVCPKADSKAFLESARKADAKLVAQVEQSERLKR
jgi:hypothetical protein